MAFSLDTVNKLVGKSRAEYECNHVVNEALTGSKSLGPGGNYMFARDYLNWGEKTELPAAGVVVVGKDGKHVGIFVSDTEFVHSSSSRYQVIKVHMSQLPYVFPNGYELRKPNVN